MFLLTQSNEQALPETVFVRPWYARSLHFDRNLTNLERSSSVSWIKQAVLTATDDAFPMKVIDVCEANRLL